MVYGEPTGLGQAILYNKGMLRIADFRDSAVRTQFINWSWESFWGQLGWMDLRLPDIAYQLTGLISALLVLLTVLEVGRALLRNSIPCPPQSRKQASCLQCSQSFC